MKKIAVWAGSSPSNRKDLARGFAKLRELEIEAYVPARTRRSMARPESATRKYLAGSDADKVKALAEIWRRPDVQDIFCVRGGYGTLRLLRHLDREKFSASKRLWGYSDVTVIQNYFYRRMGLPWVHSPMLTSTGFRAPVKSEAAAWKTILTPRSAERPNVRDFELRVLHRPRGPKPADLSGLPILGGNLTCFVSMLGTEWDPSPDAPYLLFLEDLNEAPYRLDRLLQQLSGSRALSNCRAVLLGHFTDCPKALPIVKLWAAENQLLVLRGVKAGHEPPNIPLAMGVPTDLRLKNLTLAVLTVPIPFLG